MKSHELFVQNKIITLDKGSKKSLAKLTFAMSHFTNPAGPVEEPEAKDLLQKLIKQELFGNDIVICRLRLCWDDKSEVGK